MSDLKRRHVLLLAARRYDVMASPYWAHEVYVWLQERLPNAIKIPVILKMHLGVATAALNPRWFGVESGRAVRPW